MSSASLIYSLASTDTSLDAKIARLREFGSTREMSDFVEDMVDNKQLIPILAENEELLLRAMYSHSKNDEVVQKVKSLIGMESDNSENIFFDNCIKKFINFEVEEMQLIEISLCESVIGDDKLMEKVSVESLEVLRLFINRIIQVKSANQKLHHERPEYHTFRAQSCVNDDEEDEDDGMVPEAALSTERPCSKTERPSSKIDRPSSKVGNNL